MLDAGSADEPRLFRSDRVEGQIDDHASDDDRNRERLAERPEDQGTTTEARICRERRRKFAGAAPRR